MMLRHCSLDDANDLCLFGDAAGSVSSGAFRDVQMGTNTADGWCSQLVRENKRGSRWGLRYPISRDVKYGLGATHGVMTAGVLPGWGSVQISAIRLAPSCQPQDLTYSTLTLRLWLLYVTLPYINN